MTLLAIGAADGRSSWTIESTDGRRFAVFVVDGRHYASDAQCPHNGGPLDQGWIREGRTLVCPWHWFRFDLDTGRCANHPRYDLRTYPVIERDGQLYADIGHPPTKRSWSDILRAHARDG